MFKYNGTLFGTRKKLVEQANKALHCIYKRLKKSSKSFKNIEKRN
jgi:hypothetical protein